MDSLTLGRMDGQAEEGARKAAAFTSRTGNSEERLSLTCRDINKISVQRQALEGWTKKGWAVPGACFEGPGSQETGMSQPDRYNSSKEAPVLSRQSSRMAGKGGGCNRERQR